MNLWQARRQADVAFVFENQDCTRLGDAKIDAADTCIGVRESLTQDLKCPEKEGFGEYSSEATEGL